jgi:hypothetical protein
VNSWVITLCRFGGTAKLNMAESSPRKKIVIPLSITSLIKCGSTVFRTSSIIIGLIGELRFHVYLDLNLVDFHGHLAVLANCIS